MRESSPATRAVKLALMACISVGAILGYLAYISDGAALGGRTLAVVLIIALPLAAALAVGIRAYRE